MKHIRFLLIIEQFINISFFFLTFFSIKIQPLNLILGFVCILILPGYNILNLIKPRWDFLAKVGCSSIISLAVANIIMFLNYLILYDVITSRSEPSFFFNMNLVILAIISITSVLRLISEIKKRKEPLNIEIEAQKQISRKYGKEYKLKSKHFVILVYIVSLILMCVSSFFSNVPNNEYSTNIVEYSYSYTFFTRVPFTFYIFLISSIISLIYLIFNQKNTIVTLISISFFLYCLWIIPYLQIKNYFNFDSYTLSLICKLYPTYGITANWDKGFLVFSEQLFPHRYSTSIFTTLIISYSTSMDVDFTLWFLYPLVFFFTPFFFWSVFWKFLGIKELNSNKKHLCLSLLVILTLLSPQFVKFPHSATTGVIGVVVFLLIVLELFEIVIIRKIHKINFLYVVMLYFFLSLTHTEECLYFLILIVLVNFYIIFTENKNSKILDNIQKKQKLDWILIFGLLLLVLILIFYLTQEFFGWINYYFDMLFGSLPILMIYALNFYESFKIPFLFSLRGNFTVSVNVIAFIAVAIGIYLLFCYMLTFKSQNLSLRLINLVKKPLKSIYQFVSEIFSKKIFTVVYYLSFFTLILVLNLVVLSSWDEFIFLEIIALFTSYLVFSFQILLFFKGIKFFKINNFRQNYFLIAIFSSSAISILLLLTGDIWLSLYIFHTLFLTNFIFFNLIIIQNNYFIVFLKKYKGYLVQIVFVLILLGFFYSLRALRYG